MGPVIHSDKVFQWEMGRGPRARELWDGTEERKCKVSQAHDDDSIHSLRLVMEELLVKYPGQRRMLIGPDF